MASQSSPKTPQSTATDSSTASAPTKSSQILTTSSILWMIEPIPMDDSLSSPPHHRAPCQTDRPRGGRPTSSSRRSPLARVTLPFRRSASRGQWAVRVAHSWMADHRGSLPSEGHWEAHCVVVLRRSCGVGRCPPGSDAQVPGVLSGQPESATHPCGWTEGRLREGAAPIVGSGGEGVD